MWEIFTGPMFTSKTVYSRETTPTVCAWENFPDHSHSPKQNSFTTQLIRGFSYQPDAKGLTKVNPAALCLCVVGGIERVCWGSALPPSDNLHVNAQTKAPLTPVAGALRAARPCVLSSFLPVSALSLLAARRHLANWLWGICHPLQGAYVSTSAIGKQAFQIIRWHQDTTLGEMNALDKKDRIRIPNEIWVGKMCRKEKRFQKNRCSIFHLRPTNNCSGGIHLFKSICDNSVVWVPKT